MHHRVVDAKSARRGAVQKLVLHRLLLAQYIHGQRFLAIKFVPIGGVIKYGGRN